MKSNAIPPFFSSATKKPEDIFLKPFPQKLKINSRS